MTAETILIVFDIDGTLTDSVHVHQKAFISALETCGYRNFNTNWNNYLHHTDNYIFCSIHEIQYGSQPGRADLEIFENTLHALIEYETTEKPIPALPGCLEFLQWTESRTGMDIVFATGSLMKPAMLKLSQSSISIAKDLLITANDYHSREDIVSEAIRKAKQYYSREDYRKIYSFGDGYWDYETARKLGLEFIGIGNRKLLDHGVEKFYENFSSIPDGWQNS